MDREFLFFSCALTGSCRLVPEYGYLYYKESVGLLTYFKREALVNPCSKISNSPRPLAYTRMYITMT